MALPLDPLWIAELSNYQEQSLLEQRSRQQTVIQSLTTSLDVLADQSFSKRTHHNYTELRNHIPQGQDRNSKSIIITLSCKNSFSPLRITLEDLQELILDENLDSNLLALVAPFGALPKSSETGFGCVSADNQSDGSFAISYLLRFADRDDGGNWKIRQVGIYHTFNKTTNSHLWLLLQAHPAEKDKLAMRIDQVLSSTTGRSAFLDCPSILHNLVLETYLPQWRSYVNFLGDTYANSSFNISTVDIKPDFNFELTLESLQNCKRLYDKLVQTPAMFNATRRILKTIENVQQLDGCTGRSDKMRRYMEVLCDLQTSVEVLLRQTQILINLLGSTLDLKNQQDAAQVNENLLKLTKQTAKDSASIRVITVVTLLFLPATTIATIFGMNFFDFDEDFDSIKASRGIWIYFLALAIFTTVTLVIWRLWVQREERRALRSHQKHAAASKDEKV